MTLAPNGLWVSSVRCRFISPRSSATSPGAPQDGVQEQHPKHGEAGHPGSVP